MINPDNIRKRLEDEYARVKVFSVGADKEPVFFACNYDDRSFLLVSIFLDSEIGGTFQLEKEFNIDYVYDNFDIVQAEELRNGMIDQIQKGNAEVLGSSDPKKLH